MSLSEKTKAMKADFLSKVPPEVPKLMGKALDELRASGIVEKALQVGDKLPSFELENQGGESVSSTALLEKGPLILSFYRGKW